MNTIKNSADVAVRVERHESDKNALIPDNDTGDKSSIPPLPKRVDDNESIGSDPYNSGTVDTSKSWAAHARFKRTF